MGYDRGAGRNVADGNAAVGPSPWQHELPSEGLAAEWAAVATGLPEERPSLPEVQLAVAWVSGGETASVRSAER